MTRGVAKRDHAFPQGVAPTVFMMSNPLVLPTPEQVERGVDVITAQDNRWLRCDLKTTSLLGNVLMRQLAVDHGAVETVLFRDGHLTEASASNVLIVHNGAIVAPPKDNLILPGITYDATLEFARDGGIPVDVRPVTRAEVLAADEVWLSSSSKEVLAVTTDRRPARRRRYARAAVPEDVEGVPGAQAARGLRSRQARCRLRLGLRARVRAPLWRQRRRYASGAAPSSRNGDGGIPAPGHASARRSRPGR